MPKMKFISIGFFHDSEEFEYKRLVVFSELECAHHHAGLGSVHICCARRVTRSPAIVPRATQNQPA